MITLFKRFLGSFFFAILCNVNQRMDVARSALSLQPEFQTLQLCKWIQALRTGFYSCLFSHLYTDTKDLAEKYIVTVLYIDE